MAKRQAPPGPDNFEFDTIGDVASKLPFRGYNSTLDPTNKPINFLDRGSQNVFLHPSGRVVVRDGRMLYDPTDTTIAGVQAGDVWNTSKGAFIPWRVANSKFSILSSVTGSKVWYDILTGLTATRAVADTFWDTTDLKDKLLFVLGNTNVYKWDGGIALFASAVAGTSITLTSDATAAGFASTGTVTINGTDYAYTGISGSTLTGVTGDASAQPANSVVISKVTTTANSSLTSGPNSSFTSDFIKVNNNQMALGCYLSQSVYVSKNTSYTDFSQSSPRVTGEGFKLNLDNPVNGITVRQGNFHISAGYSDWYIITLAQVTVGSTLTEQVNVAKQQSALGAAAYSHEMIDVVNDNIIYLSKDQQVRMFGTFRNLFQPAYPVISQDISTELKGVDFTLGQLRAIADEDRGITTYVVAPASGVVYLHQTVFGIDSVGNVVAERFWQPPFVWGVSRVTTIGKTVYGFSNANPQMYQLWDTNQWHDDAPGGNVPYISIITLPYRSFTRRQGKFSFDKVYWEGYMTIGTPLYSNIYYDYQGASGMISPIIHDVINSSPAPDQAFFSGIVPPSLGDSSLGDNPLGSPTNIVGLGNTALTDHDLLSKFRIITGAEPTDCFEFALAVYSYTIDARWELQAVGVNAALSEYQGQEIIK